MEKGKGAIEFEEFVRGIGHDPMKIEWYERLCRGDFNKRADLTSFNFSLVNLPQKALINQIKNGKKGLEVTYRCYIYYQFPERGFSETGSSTIDKKFFIPYSKIENSK